MAWSPSASGFDRGGGGISGQIEDLVVRSGDRNRGLGSRLLEEALSWGRARGVVRFQLGADIRNSPDLSFYRRLGFRMSRMRMLYRSKGQKKWDILAL
ncbi:MAG: GNAT family N-acetyltransferase [Nitrospirae bacterium]|nr:GNAT family N-acetyltransferase [Nitrospirota bacterium]